MKDKIIKGGFWLGIAKVSVQIFSLGINAILAFYLSPQSFGLISLVTVYLGVVSLFSNIGFGSAVIQFKEISKSQLNTLYTVNLITFLLTGIIILLSAPFASDFYNSPELTNLIRVSTISIFLTPFYIIRRKLIEKEIHFVLLSKIDIVSSFLSGIIGIVSAYMGAQAYSLVYQSISLNIFYLVFIVINSKYNFNLELKLKETKELIYYSFKFKFAQATNFLERNIDYMLIGKIFDSVTLGLYTFAFNIMYFPVKRIAYIFTEILFPAFSSLQDDLTKLRTGYLKSIQIVGIVTFPIVLIAVLYSEIVVQYFYGNKWNSAIPIIQVLSIAGAFQSIDQISGVVFDSVKKTELNIYLGIIKIVFITISVIAGSKMGIVGVAYFIVIYKIITTFMGFYLLKRIIFLKLLSILDSLKGPLLASLALVAAHFITFKYIKDIVNIHIYLLTFISITSYLLVMLFFNYKDLKVFFDIIKKRKIKV